MVLVRLQTSTSTTISGVVQDDRTDDSKEAKKRKTRAKTKTSSSKGSEREKTDADYTESQSDDEEAVKILISFCPDLALLYILCVCGPNIS